MTSVKNIAMMIQIKLNKIAILIDEDSERRVRSTIREIEELCEELEKNG